MSTFSTHTGESAALIRPIIALNVWTLVMEGWMYATRIPAMSKYNISSQPEKIQEEMQTKIPPSIRWKADNYNHLLEQPTQYYAVTLALAFLEANDTTTVNLAWGYVGLRVLHSLVQATTNKIPVRFGIFASSSAVLAAMTIKAVRLLM